VPLKSFLLILAVSFTVGCHEKFEYHYATVVEAAHAGAFDHGWLPNILRPDVTDINVWYDTASGEVRGTFVANHALVNRMTSSCSSANDVPRRTRSMPDWFPSSITTGKAASEGVSQFRCTDFFVATDRNGVKGYFWEADYPRSRNK
jgi:hypothetical protein